MYIRDFKKEVYDLAVATGGYDNSKLLGEVTVLMHVVYSIMEEN